MLYRIALALVTVFWLAMNYLLCRSEFGGRNDVGNNVPLEVVWRKMLTAPDNSSLDILHHGKKAGYCHWEAGFGHDNGIVEPMSEEAPPALGLEQKKAGYRLNLEGNASFGDAAERIHFGFVILLATNREWREFHLRLNAQKSVLTIHSLAAEHKLHLLVDNEDEKLERVLSFASLENPLALAQELKLPIPLEALGAAGLSGGRAPAAGAGAGLSWEARNDWITVGHTSLRVYRLRARLFDRREIVVLVSPVGEILRVELPDEWVLLNDQLGVL